MASRTLTSRSARPALAVLAALTIALGACSSGSSSSSGKADGTGNAAAASTTVVASAPAGKTYAVGERTETFVDHSRPTKGDAKRNIAAADSRTLPTLIVYPTTGEAAPRGLTAPTTKDAPVAEGRFPLVVFSHGVTASGQAYAPMLAAWARRGYIVAAPTFPMTSGPGAWADLTDYANQPADVSYIISEISKFDTTPGDPLAGHVDTSEVAATGHSLGGLTTLGFFNSCCRDPRVKALIAFSGARPPYPGNWDDLPQTPLLLVHGDADKTVPYDKSVESFSFFTGPRAFVSEVGAGHSTIFTSEGGHVYGMATQDSALAFLDLELRHDDSAWKALGATLDSSKVAWIQVAGGMPDAGPGGTTNRPAKGAASDTHAAPATS